MSELGTRINFYVLKQGVEEYTKLPGKQKSTIIATKLDVKNVFCPAWNCNYLELESTIYFCYQLLLLLLLLLPTTIATTLDSKTNFTP